MDHNILLLSTSMEYLVFQLRVQYIDLLFSSRKRINSFFHKLHKAQGDLDSHWRWVCMYLNATGFLILMIELQSIICSLCCTHNGLLLLISKVNLCGFVVYICIFLQNHHGWAFHQCNEFQSTSHPCLLVLDQTQKPYIPFCQMNGCSCLLKGPLPFIFVCFEISQRFIYRCQITLLHGKTQRGIFLNISIQMIDFFWKLLLLDAQTLKFDNLEKQTFF